MNKVDELKEDIARERMRLALEARAKIVIANEHNIPVCVSLDLMDSLIKGETYTTNNLYSHHIYPFLDALGVEYTRTIENIYNYTTLILDSR